MNSHNRTLTARTGGRLMKMSLLLVAVLLFAVSGFADTTYNNFNGYSDFWFPFGNPDTATYGELFTSPNNSDHNLASFTFYMGTPSTPGNIITGAYIATWTGSMAGTLLYSAGPINYDNLGNEPITINTGGLALTQNTNYVMFLSVSNFYGQSSGETHVVPGSSIPGLNGFAYFNNEGNFNELFTTQWNAIGLTPDWAVNLNFNAVPEPGTIGLIALGGLGLVGALRKRR